MELLLATICRELTLPGPIVDGAQLALISGGMDWAEAVGEKLKVKPAIAAIAIMRTAWWSAVMRSLRMGVDSPCSYVLSMKHSL